MNFISKTIYKLKLLFTDPTKFFVIMRDIINTRLRPQQEPEEGKRFTTDAETAVLQKYAGLAKIGVVEIGVLDGGTTSQMAKYCKVPIYGIDPIIPDSMNKRLIGSEEKIKKNMEFYKQFKLYKDFSFNVVKSWQHPFDFIFIDGDHNYQAVKQDFEQWLPLLANGGYMGFHDSAPVTSISGGFEGWPGPVKLMSEIKQRAGLEFIESVDSLSLFRKK
jgi:hypothetical protein